MFLSPFIAHVLRNSDPLIPAEEQAEDARVFKIKYIKYVGKSNPLRRENHKFLELLTEKGCRGHLV